MKRYLAKVVLFSLIIVVIVIGVFFQADGKTDEYYLRFTSSKQTSLILGNSRAAQGIMPQILNQVLSKNDIYNFAFTHEHSPYGVVYYNSILKKHNSSSPEKRVYILTVDPPSISSRSTNPNDESYFRELNNSLATTNFVNIKPNFEYLLKNVDRALYKIIINKWAKKKYKSFELHEDGWLEISVPMDSISLNRRLEKLKAYKTELKYSSKRLFYLNKTILYLKQFGNVYLVRLPISSVFLKKENEYFPDFDLKMDSLCQIEKVHYLNLSKKSDKFLFTDGNHLYKESSRDVSTIIGEWICQYEK